MASRVGADRIKITLPIKDLAEGGSIHEHTPVPPKTAGDVYSTEETLKAEEVQNLADEIGKLLRIGAGYDLQ